MKYAIIQSGGKQYKVSEGDELLLDRLQNKENDKILFEEVLLVRDEEKVLIGEPMVAGAKVSGKVVSHVKGPKITIRKFKAKVRLRKTMGFRSQQTKVLIENISFGQKAKTVKKSPVKTS